MEYTIIIIYLLIGFQFGARAFYRAHRIYKHPLNFIVPLIFIPLVWPVSVFGDLLTEPGRKWLFKWDI